MSYTIPDNASTPSRTQNYNGLSPLASADTGDFKILADAMAGLYGVVSGCAVTAQGSPNMTVAVAAGVVQENWRQLPVTATNVTIAANATSNPRLDLVVIDTTYAIGVPTVVQGTVGSGTWPGSSVSPLGGWPAWPSIPAHNVVLALVFVEPSDTTISSDQIIDKRVLSTEYGSTAIEMFVDGLQDYKRFNSRDLQHFYRILGDRVGGRPTNIFGLGNSVMEGYGVTDDTQKWWWQLREALQGQYRNGGVGYINARHGVGWLYLTNPDGKNAWTLTSLVDQNYYGFGPGDRTAWLGTTAGSTATITVDCDQFYLTFSSGSVGTATIDIDLGTAFAQTFTFNTADATLGMSGRIYESPVLPLGTHTIKVTSTTASSTVFLEGIMPFYTDKLAGPHFWDGSHSGVLAQYFDPVVTDSRGAGASAWWADLFYQPTAGVRSSTGVGNGTTTFTDASGAFVANDVGELITGGNSSKIPYGTRITAFGSATSVTLSNAVASGTGIAYEVQRATFTDGVTYVGATTAANGNTTVNSTTITSASNPFNAASVGSAVSGTNIPTGAVITTVNSSSSAVISQPALATGTTSTFTIGASTTLSSATAAFVKWDEGKKVLGSGIPAGTYLKRYISATLVQLSNAATATATGVSFRVQNRVKYPVQPDLIPVELGLNDVKYSITSSAHKTNIINSVQHAINRGGLDFTPSVMPIVLWAPGITFNWQDVTATTSNGSPTMTNTNGDYGQDMVGLSIVGVSHVISSVTPSASPTAVTTLTAHGLTTGNTVTIAGVTGTGAITNLNGTFVVTVTGSTTFTVPVSTSGGTYTANSGTEYDTIPPSATVSSVQSSTSLTLSANATGNVAGTAIFANRITQEFMWLRFRQAQQELADAQGWKIEDLYSLYGFIGTTDPGNFTFDLIHPNNAGSRTIADHINLDLGGVSKTGYISQGLFDNKGESIRASAADTPKKLAAPQDGECDTGAPSADVGVLTEAPGIRQIIREINPNASGGTFVAAGVAAPTVTSAVAASTVDLANGIAVRIASATSGTAASVAWATNLTRPSHIPQFGAIVSPNAASFTAARYWIGLFASTPGGADDPSGVAGAGFRYATVTDTTAFWRTWTNDGTTTGASKTTTTAIASGGVYKLRIRFIGVKGTNATAIEFYINDVLVSSHASDLPAGSALNLTPWALVNPSASAQKSLDIIQMTLVT